MSDQDKPTAGQDSRPAGETKTETAGASKAGTADVRGAETAGASGVETAAVPAGLEPLREQITIDDFLKCDFRLGKILDAEKVPGSKRLLKFTVDVGIDTRTILAGIQEHYEPEALVGKTVVVIANLAPRRMMGYDSQGMVLAAEDDGTLTVLTPFTDGLRPGARLS